MSKWNRVTSQAPCAICAKPDWCSTSADREMAICRRMDNGTGQMKRDRSGAEYYLYRFKGEHSLSIARARRPVARLINPHQTNLIYNELLRLLSLDSADASSLRARGLSDAAIAQNQYRSLPRAGRVEIVDSLLSRFNRRDLLSTPGFIKQNEFITLAGPCALIIPVRDLSGAIIALKLRRRLYENPRYVYFSSASYGGAGPGAPVHVPLFERHDLSCVRLTEGELKADVAVAFDSMPTISIAGVGGFAQALGVLKSLPAKICRLAFDMDARANPFVASALRASATRLRQEGFELEFEVWDSRYKGIDDALLNGAPISVLRAEQAWNAICDLAS